MQQRSEKDQAAINSTRLLEICIEKKYSWSTVEVISEILAPLRANGRQHDQMVIKILDILENSDTEEKVNQSLEELISKPM